MDYMKSQLKQPKIIAHRGAGFLAEHENTLEAFDYAIKLGADMVEFDIRRTSDNILVVFHDRSIDGRLLKDISYKELNEMAVQKGYHVPILEAVLDKCKGRIKLDIELKEAGYERYVIEAVKKRYSYDEYTMKSFKRQVLANIKRIDSNIITGLLVGEEKQSVLYRLKEYFPIRDMKTLKCSFVSPYYKMMTRGFLHRMKKHNIAVYPWTVNDKKALAKVIAANVDGIITDRPDIAIKLLGEMF